MGPGLRVQKRFPENGRRGGSTAWVQDSGFKKDSLRMEGGEGPQHGSRTLGSKKIP